MNRREFLRNAGLIGMVAMFPLSLFRREAGGVVVAPRSETYWERCRRTFDSTKRYGRGFEYIDNRTEIIRCTKNWANKVFPGGTPYIIVDNPCVDDVSGRLKAIYWYYGPEIHEDFRYCNDDRFEQARDYADEAWDSAVELLQSLEDNAGSVPSLSGLTKNRLGGEEAKVIDYCLAVG